MFTGIITHKGRVAEIDEKRARIEAPADLIKKLTPGASIACDGICLTATDIDETSFAIDYMPETTKRTTIGSWQVDTPINLELPVTGDTLLSGHIVQGHVDAVATVENVTPEGNSYVFRFNIPSELAAYLVEKGSITVNGISLTVVETGDNAFTVGIIPHTWEVTNLSSLKPGDKVNLETDIVAKHVIRYVKHYAKETRS